MCCTFKTVSSSVCFLLCSTSSGSRWYFWFLYVFIDKTLSCRYIPKEQTLQQIDLFCTNSIAECDTVQRTSGLNATTSTSTSVAAGSATPSSLPPTAYASTALVKSLIYVRSLVSRHIPRRSFQPAAFSGATSSKQSLPSLSSLLTKSFNSQLKPGSAGSVDSPDRRDISSPPAPPQLIGEEEKEEEAMYTFSDVLKWRWCLDREQLQALIASERYLIARFGHLIAIKYCMYVCQSWRSDLNLLMLVAFCLVWLLWCYRLCPVSDIWTIT